MFADGAARGHRRRRTPRSASRSRAPSSRSPGRRPTAAAAAAADPAPRLGYVVTAAAAAAAREALARTPDQLQVLRDAGVVDAGGRGLCVVLDAAETAAHRPRPVSRPAPLGPARDPGAAAAAAT